MYANEIAFTGQMFKKQIILYGRVQMDVLALWKTFKKLNKDIEKQIYNEYQINQTVDAYQIISKLGKLYTTMSIKFPYIDPREFDFDDSRTVRSIKRLVYNCILKQNVNTRHVYNILKRYAIKNGNKKDWYKLYSKINPLMHFVNNEVIRKYPQKDSDEQEKHETFKLENLNELNSNQVTQRMNFRNSPNNNLLKKITDQKQENMLSLTPKHNTIIERDSIHSFNFNETKCLKSQHYEDFTEYQMIKDNYDKKENNQIQSYTNLNPFPEIFIKQQKIFEILSLLKCRIEFDFNLLAEIFALEASGALLTSPNTFNPSYGESIHCLPHNLFTLQAYRKDKETGFINSIFNFFNMSYTSIGLENNNPLPKWLHFSISDGIIHIWGVPKPSEDTEILIRIINKIGFTIHSFHNYIQDKEGDDMKQKSFARLATLQYDYSPRKKEKKQPPTSVNIIQQESIDQSKLNKSLAISQKKNLTQSYKIDQQLNTNRKSQFAINFASLQHVSLTNTNELPKVNQQVQFKHEQVQFKQEKSQIHEDNVIQEDSQKKGSSLSESNIDIELAETSKEIKDDRCVKTQEFQYKNK